MRLLERLIARLSQVKAWDLLVLAVVRDLGDDARSVPILVEVEERQRKASSLGAIYGSLEKLENAGLVTYRGDGIAHPERGGRQRIYYTVTEAGRRRLEEA